MNKEHIIRKEIESIGSTVVLTDDEWTSVPFRAIISPLGKKDSSFFEKKITEIGESLSEYFYYVGASNHRITDLSENALLIYDGDKYEFKHRGKVKANDTVLYYTGILRRLRFDTDD